MKSHTKFTLCQRRRARHGSNSQRPDIYRNGVAKQFVTTQKKMLIQLSLVIGKSRAECASHVTRRLLYPWCPGHRPPAWSCWSEVCPPAPGWCAPCHWRASCDVGTGWRSARLPPPPAQSRRPPERRTNRSSTGSHVTCPWSVCGTRLHRWWQKCREWCQRRCRDLYRRIQTKANFWRRYIFLDLETNY